MNAKILIVDDEQVWLRVLETILSESGYTVQTADNYRAALSALDKEIFHLAIIDLRLEDSTVSNASGIELLRYIDQLGKRLPLCIILTGYPSTATARVSFKNYGVWDFISKLEFDEEEFRRIVRAAVDQAISKDVSRGLEENWSAFSNALEPSTQLDREAVTSLLEFVCRSVDLPSLRSLPSHEHWLPYEVESSALFANTGISPRIPLLVFQGTELGQNDLDDLQHILSHFLDQPTQIALLFVTDKQETKVMIPLERMRQLYSYDLVVLNYQNIVQILSSIDPRKKFRQAVLSRINPVSISPFITTGPAIDTIFFGREHELRQIAEHANTTSFALIGGRRIGKTSILKRLERTRLPSIGIRALYHDCSYTPTEAELIQAVTTDRAWFPTTPVGRIASLKDVIRGLPGDRPLVILLDEVDKLIYSDAAVGYSLFNVMRALSNGGHCRFVLSGEQTLRHELTNPESPLYNFANALLIGRLDKRAVEELIISPMKQLEIALTDEASIVQLIWDFTSGHPNVVQRLCQRLIVRLNQRMKHSLILEDVEYVVADPDFQRNDFLNIYWERASSLERLCSLLMAKDRHVQTLRDVHQLLLRNNVEATLGQVDSALESLVDLRNILERTGPGYDFAVTAFPAIIARTQRLEDLIFLHTELYQSGADKTFEKKGSNQ